MNVLLVQPASYSYFSGALIKEPHRKGFLSSLTLPYLAGLFPGDVVVDIVEESLQDIDFSKAYDLVCITLTTPIAKRAYEIARIFRDKGVPVVLGGYHVNLCPQEAEAHADAIILGEIEPVWNGLWEDFCSGKLKKRYVAGNRFNMQGMVFPRYDLLDYRKYSAFYGTRVPIAASRGCPHHCGFCCTPQVYPGGIIYRPVEEVVGEIKKILADCQNIKRPVFVFIDDNMTADFSRLEKLLQALIPLKIRWSGFVSTRFGMDQGMVRLARQSGCYAVFMGLESINQVSLDHVSKRFNQAREFPGIVKTLIENDIILTAGIMAGFPQDSVGTLQQTVKFLVDNRVASALINPPTPFPNTPFYNRLKAEGRLYDDHFWLKIYNPYGLFRQDHFSGPDHFFSEFNNAAREFVSLQVVFKRAWAYKKYFMPLLAYNLMHKRWVHQRGFAHVNV